MYDRILVIDTETSGLFDFSKPADAPGQPRMASLAMIDARRNPHPEPGAVGEAEWQIEGETRWLIQPDGWTMNPEAAAINGLTQEILIEQGVIVRLALDVYSAAVAAGVVVVAFNAQYDTKILRAELRRAGMPDLFEATPNICVMRASIGACAIPKARGGGYKFPRLAEAYKILCGKELDTAHRETVDARAAFDIFCELDRRGLLPEPEVHYAKNRPGNP
jgi:DNA polymerase III epsilon subunit-like protein